MVTLYGSKRALRSGLIAALVLTTCVRQPSQAQTNPLTAAPGQTSPALSSDDKAEALATNPEATAIIRSLAPLAGDHLADDGSDKRTIDDGSKRIRVDYSHSIDLTVFFPYGSARLTPEARIQLEPLGRALQAQELTLHSFLIGGNTDARGGAVYNRHLSRARAEAVRTYLIEHYSVDPRRLVAYGWGDTRLKNPSHPFAGINRRVEVSLIRPGRTGLDGHVPTTRREWAFREDGSGCRRRPSVDPRLLRGPFDLDDFGASPTPLPCDR